MSWRTIEEAEASFRPIERMLDAMLEESRANLVNEGILLREDSNRTGFGGHSYPAFIWSFHFEKRQPYGSEIKRATAQLTYRETLAEGEPQKMEVTSYAEIFQTGKQSRFSEGRKMLYPIDRFLSMRMDLIIIDCIAEAERILSKN
ncbi:MAG: hypothetical protein M3384_12925 [Acidobacteriota bacterium]|nr:hypothetical protein [Acidobacteriota bacterium]